MSLKYYLYYNQKQGKYQQITHKVEMYEGWGLLSEKAFNEEYISDFIKYTSVVFDIENRPEMEWDYKRRETIKLPSLAFMQRALLRYIDNKNYNIEYPSPLEEAK